MFIKWFYALVLCCFLIPVVSAQSNSSLTQEAIQISKELRCPDSVNQNLFESELPQASKMKAEIFQLLKEGKTREDIFKIFAEKYGQQIRYSPEMNFSTIALWVLPGGFLLLFLGIAGYLILRRQK